MQIKSGQKADSSMIYMQLRREQELNQQIKIQQLQNQLDEMRVAPEEGN